MPERPFHLAFPVTDIASTRAFYVGVLGCAEGRSALTWIDFDFFGHQLSAHVKPGGLARAETSLVDGDNVPVSHFGMVLGWEEWEALAERLRASGMAFLIEPHVRFEGKPGEQGTLFIEDPSGNALEFKAFQDPQSLFATGS